MILRHQSKRNTGAKYKIVYVGRNTDTARGITNEYLIIDALNDLLGKDNYYVCMYT